MTDRDCYEPLPVTWKDALLTGLLGGGVLSLLVWIGLVLPA